MAYEDLQKHNILIAACRQSDFNQPKVLLLYKLLEYGTS